MSIDPRGFKSVIQAEAASFLKPSQLMLNATVKNITYSVSGVEVALATGEKMLADYVLSTFSLGVLQNDDVQFHPILPDWKLEAIHGMTLVTYFLSACAPTQLTKICWQETYTKIFVQFPRKFWFDTEVRMRDFSCASGSHTGLSI